MILSFVVLLAALNGYQIHAGKISSGLLSKLQNVEKSDAIFELPSVFGKVMSNPALSFLSGSAKSDMMETLMKQTTSASQALFMSALSRLGLAESATPFWISNDIALKNVNLSVNLHQR